MGETTRAVIAGIDAPTAGIVAAIITGFAALAARWAPKTRSEAAVDRSRVVVDERERWRILFDEQEKAIARRDVDAERREEEHRSDITRLEGRVDELSNELQEERRECDRQISELSAHVIRLSRAVPEQRVWFFDDGEKPTA